MTFLFVIFYEIIKTVGLQTCCISNSQNEVPLNYNTLMILKTH